MKSKAAVYGLLLLGGISVSATLGFVAFPGCAAPDSSTAYSSAAYSPAQGDYYRSALHKLEKMQKDGELPGVEPTAQGTFSATWVWYDQNNSRDNEMRAVFQFSDGRPPRCINLAYANGWQVVSITDNRQTKPRPSAHLPLGPWTTN